MSLVRKQYDEFVFGLKYRPSKIEDIILPKRLKNLFIKMRDTKDIGNIILSGQQGCGKTTTAFCLSDETELDTKYMRMSKDTSIENIRKEVLDFISNVAMFSDGKKIFIGDEFENLSPKAMDALKTEIEIFTKNVNFIFITNHKHKVDPILLSRLDEIDFVFTQEERIQMKKELALALVKILKAEGIGYEKEALIKCINMYFPDIRKVINFVNLVRKQNENMITMNFLENSLVSNTDLMNFYTHLANKDFSSVRKMITVLPIDLTTFYSTIFNTIDTFVVEETLPQAILILNEHQHISTTSPDPQIPLSACCIQLMNECEWRK